MSSTGTAQKSTVVSGVVGYVLGFVASLLPALVSIYNPHQYATDPLFIPDAVRNVSVATVFIVLVTWFFARRWSPALVVWLFVAGLVLTVASFALVCIASAVPSERAGGLMLGIELTGTLAIPCMALLGVVWANSRAGGGSDG